VEGEDITEVSETFEAVVEAYPLGNGSTILLIVA
jgi:hypothetical protein